MIDREKVINGLELCRHMIISHENCKKCPYFDDERARKSSCEGVLHWDAIALIKEYGEIPLRCKTCSFYCDGWCKRSGYVVTEIDYCSLGAWEGR